MRPVQDQYSSVLGTMWNQVLIATSWEYQMQLSCDTINVEKQEDDVQDSSKARPRSGEVDGSFSNDNCNHQQ